MGGFSETRYYLIHTQKCQLKPEVMKKMKFTLHRPGKECGTEYPIIISSHAKRRADQRGVTSEQIQLALNYCKSYFMRDHIYHVVKATLIPDYIHPEYRKQIKNLVLVVSKDDATLITCYKDQDASRNIKRKGKTLQ